MLGTRPEIIKLAHVIRLLGPAAVVLHTGQHYDRGLSGTFIDAFGLDEPDAYLGVGGSDQGPADRHGGASARRPAHRTATGCGGGPRRHQHRPGRGPLPPTPVETPLVHVEAGLRSYDRRMPEEHNRVLVDHIGDLLCAPTDVSRKNLLEEGIPESRISVTGNTVVEAVLELMPEQSQRAPACSINMGSRTGSFVLSTFHRPENVDDPERFRALLRPARLPRTASPSARSIHAPWLRATEHGMGDLLAEINGRRTHRLPTSSSDLGAESAFLVSDSGGVQEEVSVYKRSVIVVRRSTERPEVLGHFRRAGRARAWHLGGGPRVGRRYRRATSASGRHPLALRRWRGLGPDGGEDRGAHCHFVIGPAA